MPLSLSAQNFLDVFAPSPTNVSSLEQEDPSSNSSQILDWIAEVLDTQSLDWGEPPLRVRNSLRNIGTGNEVLFDGLMRLLRFHLNNQGRQLAQSMAESSQRISNVPGLFEWIVSARQKSIYFASLAALVAEQVRLVTRCINAIFQATAMDPVVFLGLREWYDNGLFSEQGLISHEQLVETAEILNQIELGDELTQMVIELFKDRIKLHVQAKCSRVWSRPVLQDLSNWTHQILVPKLGDILPTCNLSSLDALVKNELVKLRVEESFDIVVDYPDSTFALQELRACMSTPEQSAQLVNTFIHLLRKRLLHAGVNTIDIIKCYISTVRSFLIIDHRGVLLDKVCRPIRAYLRDREDTIERIVFALLDTSTDNKLIELAIELRQSDKKKRLTHEMERDLDWTPDPVDALPDFRKGVVEDVVESLISIFDSKDVFMSELTKVFSEQLLRITNYDVREVYGKLQLLKSRFGNSEFLSLDVMLKDIIQSRKLDKLINSDKVHASIISHMYWPELPEEKFKLPEEIQTNLQQYEEEFKRKKKGRRLTIFPSLTYVDIDVEIGNRVRNFNVSADKASILYSFLDMPKGSEVKLAMICMKLQMSLKLVSEGLIFWVKQGVLKDCGVNTYKINE